MTAPKHTAGPWEFTPGLNYYGVSGDDAPILGTVEAPDATASARWHIAVVVADLEESEANARLIAAAPCQHDAGREIDRLSLVIESAVRNADPVNHEAVLAALKANRAALQRATGGESQGEEHTGIGK